MKNTNQNRQTYLSNSLYSSQKNVSKKVVKRNVSKRTYKTTENEKLSLLGIFLISIIAISYILVSYTNIDKSLIQVIAGFVNISTTVFFFGYYGNNQ